MRVSLSCSIVLFVLACGASHRDATPTVSVNAEHGLDTAEAYRTAIADHIHAMDTSAAPLPDTVYIGRHAEFPRIELPTVIARRFVRIIDPAEGESEKHRAHFAYLNIFPMYAPEQVEFYVIRFAQGMRHQPDGSEDRHLYYRVGEKKELVLERMSR